MCPVCRSSDVPGRYPRVRVLTFPPAPSHLLPCPLAASGFALDCRLTQAGQPHLRRRPCRLLPVRRVVGLPVASFRPHLAVVALAFSYWARAASPRVDFHHQVSTHAGCTNGAAVGPPFRFRLDSDELPSSNAASPARSSGHATRRPAQTPDPWPPDASPCAVVPTPVEGPVGACPESAARWQAYPWPPSLPE